MEEKNITRNQLKAIANSEKSTKTERMLATLLIEERNKISEVVEKKNKLYGMMYKVWLFMENEEGIHEKRKKELENNVEEIKRHIDKVFITPPAIAEMVENEGKKG